MVDIVDNSLKVVDVNGNQIFGKWENVYSTTTIKRFTRDSGLFFGKHVFVSWITSVDYVYYKYSVRMELLSSSTSSFIFNFGIVGYNQNIRDVNKITQKTISNRTVKLDWDDSAASNADVKGYLIYIDGKSLDIVSPSEYKITVPDLNKEYTYNIIAFDYMGVRTRKVSGSNIKVKLTGGTTPPVVPPVVPPVTPVKPTTPSKAPDKPLDFNIAVDTSKYDNATLSWKPPTSSVGVKEYIIYYYESGNTTPKKQTVAHLSTTKEYKQKITGLNLNKRYDFYIKTKNNAGLESIQEGPVYKPVKPTQTTPTNPPVTPTTPTNNQGKTLLPPDELFMYTMDKNGKPEVQLFWYTPTGSAPIDKYVVTEYVDDKKGREKVVANNNKGGFSLYLTNLDKKKQYYYVIKSLDAEGNSSKSSKKFYYNPATGQPGSETSTTPVTPPANDNGNNANYPTSIVMGDEKRVKSGEIKIDVKSSGTKDVYNVKYLNVKSGDDQKYFSIKLKFVKQTVDSNSKLIISVIPDTSFFEKYYSNEQLINLPTIYSDDLKLGSKTSQYLSTANSKSDKVIDFDIPGFSVEKAPKSYRITFQFYFKNARRTTNATIFVSKEVIKKTGVNDSDINAIKIIKDKLKVGTFVRFGKTKDGKPIDWVVVSWVEKPDSKYSEQTSGNNNLIILFSVYTLYKYAFHSTRETNYWGTSDVRKHLNGDFLSNFTKDERNTLKQYTYKEIIHMTTFSTKKPIVGWYPTFTDEEKANFNPERASRLRTNGGTNEDVYFPKSEHVAHTYGEKLSTYYSNYDDVQWVFYKDKVFLPTIGQLKKWIEKLNLKDLYLFTSSPWSLQTPYFDNGDGLDLDPFGYGTIRGNDVRIIEGNEIEESDETSTKYSLRPMISIDLTAISVDDKKSGDGKSVNKPIIIVPKK